MASQTQQATRLQAQSARTVLAPITLRTLEIRNRIVMPAASQHHSSQDGMMTPWHQVYYGARAMGGVGLIILEDTAVRADGRVSSRSPGLYTDEQQEALARVVSFCRDEGAAVGVQISHAGRRAYRNERKWDGQMIAPSPLPQTADDRRPRALSGDEIKGVVAAFVRSAERAVGAGADIVTIDAGHGHLLHQFLSSLSNVRFDAYGHDVRGGERLLREVIVGVRHALGPHRVLGLSIPVSRAAAGDLTVAEAGRLVRSLASEGVDLVDLCHGGIGGARTGRERERDGWQRAKALRAVTGVPTVGTRTADTLWDGCRDLDGVDLVAMGAALLQNPNWSKVCGRSKTS